MTDTDTDDVTRAVAELGEPDALFLVGRGRLLAKLAVGVALVLFGLALNYYWWVHGPRRFGHLELLLLLGPPTVGASLLLHMHRSRGLVVLVYPTGLLRLRRGEVDSFPWAEVDALRLRVNRADAAVVERDDGGRLTACHFPVDVPAFQIWKAGFSLERADGAEAHFGPALSLFDRLAAEAQRRTFAALWPKAVETVRAGGVLPFEELVAGPVGLHHADKLLPWRELKEVAIAQGKLTVKQDGKWLPWATVDVAGVPNPHLLAALADELRATAVPVPDDDEDDEDDDSDAA